MTVKCRCDVTLYKVIDIDKVTRYYLLQSSTLATPSKPTDGVAISDNWIKTEPSYTSGSTLTLYFVDQMVMSNGEIKYSEVSKSSSYEAAKEAWNKAKNAQDTANSVANRVTAAETSIENNATQIALRATQTYVDAINDDMNTFRTSTTTLIQNINGWQFNWDKVINTSLADIPNHQDYITLQNGDIILGESGSDLKLKISNDAIQFKGNASEEVTPDDDATAWITGEKFNINTGEVHNSFKIGAMSFLPRANGNFSITKL